MSTSPPWVGLTLTPLRINCCTSSSSPSLPNVVMVKVARPSQDIPPEDWPSIPDSQTQYAGSPYAPVLVFYAVHVLSCLIFICLSHISL